MTARELSDRFFDLSAEIDGVADQLATLALIVVPRESAFPEDLPTDNCFKWGWSAMERHLRRIADELEGDGPKLEDLDNLGSEISSVADILYVWQNLSKNSSTVDIAFVGGINWDDAIWAIEQHLERIGEDVSMLGLRLKKEERDNAESKGQR